MKAWGIIATILFLASAAAAGWFYAENVNLKKDVEAKSSTCQGEKDKIETTKTNLETLSLFSDTYLVVNPTASTDLDTKITQINNRNLEVAYENYKNAAAKDKIAALGSFLSEYVKALGESLGEQVNAETDTSATQSSKNQSSQIEGEGDYSGNVFPK